jgi:DNA-binding NarL/FixJ family response regulator
VIRVYLVDDHQLVLSGIRSELEATFDIVGAAADVDTAIAGIRATEPAVVLLDVHMPGGGALTVLSALHDQLEHTRFLALSVSDEAQDVIAVVRAGARGYVTKSIAPSELTDAVHRVAAGDAVFSPRLAGFVLDAFRGDPAAPAPSDPELDQLTPREQEVLRLIARGHPYKQVARKLSISIKTVETHVSSVLRKLQLSSRHEITRWATDRRLI